jgi:hypothetical protein
MAKARIRPEDEHREEIISIFFMISKKKREAPKFVTRSEIECEILSNPGRYPLLNAVKLNYLRIVISKVLNSDLRAEKNLTWRRAWALKEET